MATGFLLCYVLLFIVLSSSASKECGHVSQMNQTCGLITSHTHFGSSHYPSRLNCTWILEARDGYSVHLVSLMFDLENSTRCSNDRLSIIFGNENHSFCGQNGPTGITSIYSLKIAFSTNGNTERLGFLIRYSYIRRVKTSESCSNSTILKIPGMMKSPNYPLMYDNDCTCRWIIHTGTGQAMIIDIIDLEIEGNIDEGCPYDYLLLYDSTIHQIIGRLCGHISKKSIYTTSNDLVVEFVTDGQNRERGFLITWTFEKPAGITNLPESTGTILSSLEAPTSTLSLIPQLPTIRHSETSALSTPYTLPISQPPQNSRPVAPSPTPPVIQVQAFTLPRSTSSLPTSSTNHGLINSSQCDNTVYLNGSSGYISLPSQPSREYYPNTDCQWIIIGNPKAVIVANFEFFQLEGSKGCTADYLSFYAGINSSSPIITTVCGKVLPASVVASSNKMLIQFHSDANIQGGGFIIHYLGIITVMVTDPPVLHCPKDVVRLHSQSGGVTSIGYNGVDSYSPNLNCQWVISTIPGKVISIQLEDFETEFASDCSYDYLEIQDGSDDSAAVLAKYCGIRLPRSVISSSNNIYIKFVSDAAVGGIGFNLTYQTTDPTVICNSTQFTCMDGSCILTSSVCNNITDCRDGSDEIICDINDTCGRPTIRPNLEDHRIVGGEEALRGSWPWQASVSYNNGYMCGGTLIHPYWVLTAAHCFQQNNIPRQWEVAIGKHHLMKAERNIQTISAADIIIHRKYESSSSYNDIALIKLSSPANITHGVDIACLPTVPVYTGQRCYATGWGETLGTCCPGVLKQAMLPVLNTTQCNRPDFYNGAVLDSMLCAGYLTKHIDACHGDSGGPLICQYSDGRWYLQGIISWGIGCADLKHPGIYTRVYHFISWIQHIIYQI